MSSKELLNDIEKNTGPIGKVREHLEERLETHRKANEASTLDPTKTAVLRGRIAELRYILGRL